MGTISLKNRMIKINQNVNFSITEAYYEDLEKFICEKGV